MREKDMAVQNPETFHSRDPLSSVHEIELPYSIEEAVWSGRIAPEDIASIGPASIEGWEERKGVSLDRLQSDDMLHILFDKTWDPEGAYDVYSRVLYGRVVSSAERHVSFDASPCVRLGFPLELIDDHPVQKDEIVTLGGVLYRPQDSGSALETGAIRGGERFCIFYRETLIDLGEVAVIRVNTAKPYDDSHWG